MRKIIILFLFLATLLSCSNNDVSTSKDYQGKWQLTQMTGRTANSETTGSNMEWQESYLLNADGTFKKSREKNGVVTQIYGTYSLVNSSNGNIVQFTYSIESEIIGSCSSQLKEEMHFQSESIFFSNWQQCDGPGLKYEKVY
jgi:hypothetical protein